MCTCFGFVTYRTTIDNQTSFLDLKYRKLVSFKFSFSLSPCVCVWLSLLFRKVPPVPRIEVWAVVCVGCLRTFAGATVSLFHSLLRVLFRRRDT